MSVDLKLPIGTFIRLSVSERKHLNGGQINNTLVDEEIERAVAAWHNYRKPKRTKSGPFVPPTPEEVTAYSIEIGFPLDGVAWCLGYALKGWCTSGSAKMKNWRLAVQKWKREGWTTKHRPSMPQNGVSIPTEPRGWAEYMRQHCPNWQRFGHEENGEQLPAWSQLRTDERKLILELMV